MICAPSILQDLCSPHVSAFVEAHAGTGKTHILVQRLIHLLLAGVPAHTILCITYTNAAAIELRERLSCAFEDFMHTDHLPCAESILPHSSPAINATQDVAMFREQLQQGVSAIKIKTLHAFCADILRTSYKEAGIQSTFCILDESEYLSWVRIAQDLILEYAHQDTQSLLVDALCTLSSSVGETKLLELLAQLVQTDEVSTCYPTDMAVIERALSHKLDISLVRTSQDDLQEWRMARDVAGLERVAEHLQKRPGKRDQEVAMQLCAYAASLRSNSSHFDDIGRQLFLTRAGGERKHVVSSSSDASIRAFIREEQTSFLNCLYRQTNYAVRDNTCALFAVAVATKAVLEKLKMRSEFLTYSDLPRRVKELFSACPSVLYDVDKRIDHILIDEAQDMSAIQWCLIERMTDEYFSQKHDKPRTIFAVGDTKQSIFSFQGAEPTLFLQKRDLFRTRAQNADCVFMTYSLTCSFRSGACLLAAVDHVFQNSVLRASLLTDSTLHHDHVHEHESFVEIWEAESGQDTYDKNDVSLQNYDDGDDARHNVSEKSIQRLSDRITTCVDYWLTRVSPFTNKPCSVLILFRARTSFTARLEEDLRECGVLMTSSTHGRLLRVLLIRDVLACAHFVLCPYDDLNLVALLKSPFIDMTEDMVFYFSYHRTHSLWQNLQEIDVHIHGYSKEYNDKLQSAICFLKDILSWDPLLSPFGFFMQLLRQYSHILMAYDERDATFSEVLLEKALMFEESNVPSLQLFLDWLENGGDIVQDTFSAQSRDQSTGSVRLTTVHSAKGLAADIVILADATRALSGRHLPDTFLSPVPDVPFIWVPQGDIIPVWAQHLRVQWIKKEEHEDRRLLYVAMTRARLGLYVGGLPCPFAHATSPSWYHLIREGLDDFSSWDPTKKSWVFADARAATSEMSRVLDFP